MYNDFDCGPLLSKSKQRPFVTVVRVVGAYRRVIDMTDFTLIIFTLLV